jgi:hypothetical protein
MNRRTYCALITVVLIVGTAALEITGHIQDAAGLFIAAAITFAMGLTHD